MSLPVPVGKKPRVSGSRRRRVDNEEQCLVSPCGMFMDDEQAVKVAQEWKEYQKDTSAWIEGGLEKPRKPTLVRNLRAGNSRRGTQGNDHEELKTIVPSRYKDEPAAKMPPHIEAKTKQRGKAVKTPGEGSRRGSFQSKSSGQKKRRGSQGSLPITENAHQTAHQTKQIGQKKTPKKLASGRQTPTADHKASMPSGKDFQEIIEEEFADHTVTENQSKQSIFSETSSDYKKSATAKRKLTRKPFKNPNRKHDSLLKDSKQKKTFPSLDDEGDEENDESEHTSNLGKPHFTENIDTNKGVTSNPNEYDDPSKEKYFPQSSSAKEDEDFGDEWEKGLKEKVSKPKRKNISSLRDDADEVSSYYGEEEHPADEDEPGKNNKPRKHVAKYQKQHKHEKKRKRKVISGKTFRGDKEGSEEMSEEEDIGAENLEEWWKSYKENKKSPKNSELGGTGQKDKSGKENEPSGETKHKMKSKVKHRHAKFSGDEEISSDQDESHKDQKERQHKKDGDKHDKQYLKKRRRKEKSGKTPQDDKDNTDKEYSEEASEEEDNQGENLEEWWKKYKQPKLEKKIRRKVKSGNTSEDDKDNAEKENSDEISEEEDSKKGENLEEWWESYKKEKLGWKKKRKAKSIKASQEDKDHVDKEGSDEINEEEDSKGESLEEWWKNYKQQKLEKKRRRKVKSDNTAQYDKDHVDKEGSDEINEEEDSKGESLEEWWKNFKQHKLEKKSRRKVKSSKSSQEDKDDVDKDNVDKDNVDKESSEEMSAEEDSQGESFIDWLNNHKKTEKSSKNGELVGTGQNEILQLKKHKKNHPVKVVTDRSSEKDGVSQHEDKPATSSKLTKQEENIMESFYVDDHISTEEDEPKKAYKQKKSRFETADLDKDEDSWDQNQTMQDSKQKRYKVKKGQKSPGGIFDGGSEHSGDAKKTVQDYKQNKSDFNKPDLDKDKNSGEQNKTVQYSKQKNKKVRRRRKSSIASYGGRSDDSEDENEIVQDSKHEKYRFNRPDLDNGEDSVDEYKTVQDYTQKKFKVRRGRKSPQGDFDGRSEDSGDQDESDQNKIEERKRSPIDASLGEGNDIKDEDKTRKDQSGKNYKRRQRSKSNEVHNNKGKETFSHRESISDQENNEGESKSMSRVEEKQKTKNISAPFKLQSQQKKSRKHKTSAGSQNSGERGPEESIRGDDGMEEPNPGYGSRGEPSGKESRKHETSAGLQNSGERGPDESIRGDDGMEEQNRGYGSRGEPSGEKLSDRSSKNSDSDDYESKVELEIDDVLDTDEEEDDEDTDDDDQEEEEDSDETDTTVKSSAKEVKKKRKVQKLIILPGRIYKNRAKVLEPEPIKSYASCRQLTRVELDELMIQHTENAERVARARRVPYLDYRPTDTTQTVSGREEVKVYLERHKIAELLKSLFAAVTIQKPDSPLDFLITIASEINKQQQASGLTASHMMTTNCLQLKDDNYDPTYETSSSNSRRSAPDNRKSQKKLTSTGINNNACNKSIMPDVAI